MTPCLLPREVVDKGSERPPWRGRVKNEQRKRRGRIHGPGEVRKEGTLSVVENNGDQT